MVVYDDLRELEGPLTDGCYRVQAAIGLLRYLNYSPTRP